jgi:predicted HTH domain antitoxin
MATIMVQIPDDVLSKLKCGGTDASQELRLAAAFSLCSRGELSTSQAARLAGLPYADFLKAAAHAKLELFPVDLDELTEAINRGQALGGQCVAGDPSGPGGPT